MVCLETSFLVDVLRGHRGAVARLQELQDSSESVTVAAPTLFELSEGAHLAETSRERELILELLQSLTVLPLDSNSALEAGRVSASLVKQGEQIGQMDLLIGAIAMQHNERLLTKNARHFSRMPRLEVESY